MFEITEEQQKIFENWKTIHNKKCVFSDPMKQGAIGGRFTYIFTPTGLGVITKVKCACGDEIDLTNSENW